MRIEVSDPRRCVALRDYFLRLGAVAVLGEGSSVDVHFPDDRANTGENVDAYLQSWVETNQVPAAVAPQAVVAPPASPSALAPPRVPRLVAPETPARIGDLLVAKGFISPEQLTFAVAEARETGELLGRLLLRYEWVFESELARVLAEQWGLPYLNLASVGFNKELVRLLPREVGLQAAAIPVRRMEGATQVAFADPTDPTALAAVREYIPSLTPVVAELSDIENAWRMFSPPPDEETDRQSEPNEAKGVPGRPKIGELFLEGGLVTRADLDDALEEQKTTGKPLGEILVARRLIDRMHLASALSKQWSSRRQIQPAEESPAPESHAPETPAPESAAPDNGQPVDLPEEQDAELAALVRAVLDLKASVESLRGEIELRGRRSSADGGFPGFNAATL